MFLDRHYLPLIPLQINVKSELGDTPLPDLHNHLLGYHDILLPMSKKYVILISENLVASFTLNPDEKIIIVHFRKFTTFYAVQAHQLLAVILHNMGLNSPIISLECYEILAVLELSCVLFDS